jgi:hypothetical protein
MMKDGIPAVIVLLGCLLSAGCMTYPAGVPEEAAGGTRATTVAPPVTAADVAKFCGRWSSQGKLFMVIRPEGDSLKLEAIEQPAPMGWRIVIRNATVSDGKLKWEQLHYWKNGSHPFNGTLCRTEVFENPADSKMYITVATDVLPNPPAELIIKAPLLASDHPAGPSQPALQFQVPDSTKME